MIIILNNIINNSTHRHLCMWTLVGSDPVLKTPDVYFKKSCEGLKCVDRYMILD